MVSELSREKGSRDHCTFLDGYSDEREYSRSTCTIFPIDKECTQRAAKGLFLETSDSWKSLLLETFTNQQSPTMESTIRSKSLFLETSACSKGLFLETSNNRESVYISKAYCPHTAH